MDSQNKPEKRPLDEVKLEQPVKIRKRLSLQEYNLRRGVCLTNSSATVSRQSQNCSSQSNLPANVGKSTNTKISPDGIDPINQAANRILLRLKKNRVEANRRKEEAMIRSRLRSTEGSQLKALMSPLLVSESSDPSCRSTSSLSGSSGYQSSSATSSMNENHLPVDERKVVFVGRLEKDATKQALGNKFAKFGRVVRVRIHRHDNGTLYGFVTYERACDAWAAVKAASTFARYDVRFGAHCAFFRQ